MKAILLLSVLALSSVFNGFAANDEFVITKSELLDKIKGGWAGQTIGVCFGGPTEFDYQGVIMHDTVKFEWSDQIVNRYFNNDDIYMDITFVEVFERLGLDAPADSFAISFANAKYGLAHANQAARYNILNGIPEYMSRQCIHWHSYLMI